MPQTVAELEEPDAVLRRHDGAIAREIGEVGDTAGQPFLFALADMPRSLVPLELAKSARKSELLLVVQRLVAEYQNSVLVHCGVNAGDIGAGERCCAIYAEDLASERPGNWRDNCRHWSLLERAPPIHQKFIAADPGEH